MPATERASPNAVWFAVVIPALCRDHHTHSLLQIALQYFALRFCPLGSMPCLSQGIYDKGRFNEPSLRLSFSKSTMAFIQGFSEVLRTSLLPILQMYRRRGGPSLLASSASRSADCGCWRACSRAIRRRGAGDASKHG